MAWSEEVTYVTSIINAEVWLYCIIKSNFCIYTTSLPAASIALLHDKKKPDRLTFVFIYLYMVLINIKYSMSKYECIYIYFKVTEIKFEIKYNALGYN